MPSVSAVCKRKRGKGEKEKSCPSFSSEGKEHREVKKALAKKRLEEDRKTLLNNVKMPDPVAYWPEVVVRGLLKHLDTRTRIILWESFPSVRKAWGTKNATWMLAEALFVPQLYFTLANHDGILDPHSGNVDLGDLRSVRLVCRDWKYAVENFYDTMSIDSRPIQFHSTQSDYRNFLVPRICNFSGTHLYYEGNWDRWLKVLGDELQAYSFTTSFDLKITRFLEHFSQSTSSSAIIYKAIQLRFESCWRHHVANAFALLDQCGNQIRYAELFLYAPGNQVMDMQILAHCLRRTPRLTTLLLNYYSIACKTNTKCSVDIELPSLPELVNLWICSLHYYMEAPIFQSLSSYFDQLHTMVAKDVPFMKLLDSQRHSKFPNLLRVSICVETVEELFKLRHWTSPLKEVVITMMSGFHCTLQVHLHALEHFWPTLCAIKIVGDVLNKRAVTLKGLALPVPPSFPLPQLSILSFSVCYRSILR